ncbi:MAG: hypothetical protein ACE5KT_08390 [Methanosarcinales archaeon]
MAINGALEYIINHIGQEGYIKNSIQKILEYERNEEISKYEKKYNLYLKIK